MQKRTTPPVSHILDGIKLAPPRLGKLKDLGSWVRDLGSESDSINLCFELRRRREEGFVLSEPFWAFERGWLADEQDHYHGFVRLLWLLFLIPPAIPTLMLSRRRAEFTTLDWYLQDELRLLVFILVDEIAAYWAYSAYIAGFKQLGDKRFVEWIKAVAFDELIHYQNALVVVQSVFRPRLKEVPAILNLVVDHYLRKEEYKNTFLGEGAGIDRSEANLRRAEIKIMRDLGL